jgi:hypothetical protein
MRIGKWNCKDVGYLDQWVYCYNMINLVWFVELVGCYIRLFGLNSCLWVCFCDCWL